MTGDSLTSIANTEQFNGQTCGHKFVCRMRTNDESKRYISMMVSVAVYRDSTNVDKTLLMCTARRSPLNELNDNPVLLGLDQLSSRIN